MGILVNKLNERIKKGIDELKREYPDLCQTNETEVIAECKDLSCDSDKKLFNGLEEDNLECKIILNNN